MGCTEIGDVARRGRTSAGENSYEFCQKKKKNKNTRGAIVSQVGEQQGPETWIASKEDATVKKLS